MKTFTSTPTSYRQWQKQNAQFAIIKKLFKTGKIRSLPLIGTTF